MRGSPLRLLIPCVVAALSQGCDRPVLRDVVEGNVRDSAGVRLVEFVRRPKGEGALRFASRARLRLGGLRDNDSLEFDPRGIYLTATRLADGRLVVGDNRRLKFFKSDGSPQQIVGRGGAGPGEFSAIRDLCPQSDSTLVVLDDDGRWTVWSRDGTLLHTQSRVGQVPGNACSLNGTILSYVSPFEGSFAPSARPMRSMAIFQRDGSLLYTIGRQPADEYYGQLFFVPSFTLSANTLLIADARTFEVRQLVLPSLATVQRISLRNGLRELTRGEWDSINLTLFPFNATATQRKDVLARLEQLGKPATYPAFSQVRSDPTGRIWINPYFDHQHWYVIDRDATRLSRVTLPFAESERPRLVGFAGSDAVIRHLDEDGAVVLSFIEVLSTNPARADPRDDSRLLEPAPDASR